MINVVAGSFNVAFILTFIRMMHEQGLRVAQDLFSSIITLSIGLLYHFSTTGILGTVLSPFLRFRLLCCKTANGTTYASILITSDLLQGSLQYLGWRPECRGAFKLQLIPHDLMVFQSILWLRLQRVK